jgi:amino acid adenylation domain-containing protein
MHAYLLPHLLAESAWKRPENLAVLFKDRTMTYSELEANSNQLARLLARNGVKPRDRIGLLLGKSMESIVCLFGVLKAGAIYVPIDPAAPVSRMRHIMRNCGIRFLIASGKGAGKYFGELGSPEGYPDTVLLADSAKPGRDIQEYSARTLHWQDLSAFEDLPIPVIPGIEVDPAYILHTSGSTGIPKGVVISHRNALSFVDMAADFFGIRPEDRLCNHASLTFDLSMFDIYVAIKTGAAVVLVPENLSMFPVKLAEYISGTSITVWNSVSSVLSLLAVRGNLEKYRFPELRIVIFSGEILPAKYLRTLMAHMKETTFYNIYGQTEANSSTFYRVDAIPGHDRWKIPVGKPFPNFEVFLLDDEGQIVGNPGREGELYVKGPTVAIGYWGDADKTREKFVPDPRMPDSPVCVYRTGDLIRFDEDGNLVFLGRKDHLVKSRGYRIELEEVEVALNSHPSVRQAAAIPVPDELIGNRIVACVSRLEGADMDAKDILHHCSRIIPQYMVPESVLFYMDLPRNANGKVDRKKLVRDFLENSRLRGLDTAQQDAERIH